MIIHVFLVHLLVSELNTCLQFVILTCYGGLMESHLVNGSEKHIRSGQVIQLCRPESWLLQHNRWALSFKRSSYQDNIVTKLYINAEKTVLQAVVFISCANYSLTRYCGWWTLQRSTGFRVLGLSGSQKKAEDTQGVEAQRSDEDYEPSRQWVIWAIMFGVLILAVVLTL